MIEVQDLAKRYGDTPAVDGLSFRAEPGAVLGLLGPNGAGKSTTIACIAGLVAPSAGHVLVDGHDVVRAPRRAKAALGFVPQEVALYEELSARENLRYFAGLYGLGGRELAARCDELLAEVGLLDRAGHKVEAFSGGMKRRLNFACGVAHRPRVLLLDEPTVGVDPHSRAALFDLVRAERERGTTVLYTTHYMEEAEALCDRLVIVDHGELVAEGSLDELRRAAGQRDLVTLRGAFAGEALGAALAGLEAEVMRHTDDELLLACEEGARRIPDLLAAVSAAGGTVDEATLRRPSLEGLFLQLTGRELRE